MLTPNSATLTSQPVASFPKKVEQAGKVVSANSTSNEDTQTKTPDPNHEDMPTPMFSPPQEDLKPTTQRKQYANAKPSERNDLPFAIEWMSDLEASRMPTKDILFKSKVKSKESFKPSPINTRKEATNYLNVNFSFANNPSRAFESSDYFFFSAPFTQDFSSGFIITKKTGEILTW